jgi:hypothetical protein
MIASSEELQSKARMWLRRELRVFVFLHLDDEGFPTGQGLPTSDPTAVGNPEFYIPYVVAILMAVDLKASNGHAENLITEFLGRENARLFLHEVNSWLRSPFTKLSEWDRNVQYREQLQPPCRARDLQ